MDDLTRRSATGLLQFVVVLALILFIAAGTLQYWQGWLYLGVFAGCSLALTLYLLRHDRDLLVRRLSVGPTAEKQRAQQVIQAVASVAFTGMLLVPGLDRRFGWTHVPTALSLLAAVIVALGFFVIFRVFRANSFTSATVEVAADQRVIASGPYGVVRHPMYAGAVVLFAATPPAIGSWAGEAGSGLLLAVLVWRLLDEEKYLVDHLTGYREYRLRVRHRLLPGVW